MSAALLALVAPTAAQAQEDLPGQPGNSLVESHTGGNEPDRRPDNDSDSTDSEPASDEALEELEAEAPEATQTVINNDEGVTVEVSVTVGGSAATVSQAGPSTTVEIPSAEIGTGGAVVDSCDGVGPADQFVRDPVTGQCLTNYGCWHGPVAAHWQVEVLDKLPTVGATVADLDLVRVGSLDANNWPIPPTPTSIGTANWCHENDGGPSSFDWPLMPHMVWVTWETPTVAVDQVIADVSDQLTGHINFATPAVHTAPPGLYTWTRMPTRMWVDDFVLYQAQAETDLIRIELRAVPAKVVWQTGDGEVEICMPDDLIDAQNRVGPVSAPVGCSHTWTSLGDHPLQVVMEWDLSSRVSIRTNRTSTFPAAPWTPIGPFTRTVDGIDITVSSLLSLVRSPG